MLNTSLNAAQSQAVELPACHALILAGAGSGKTRVLIHRLAYLFETHKLSPFEIMAVTFTNKAAQELKDRIQQSCQLDLQGMWVGTFHSLALRFLRHHADEANLPNTFQIMDTEDQLRAIRRLLKRLNIDEERFPPKPIAHFINEQKDAIRRASALQSEGDPLLGTYLKIYLAYERYCQENGLVDFSELLLRCYELLRDHHELREYYQRRFKHILVDEFQDTNLLQYAWLKLLIGPNNCLMAVGDDDQSIYSFRGAKVENLQKLKEDFHPLTLIRLEQNYRSSQTILNAANAVIAQNTDRLGKTLWTSGEAGTPIEIYAGFNEIDEARFITSRIQQAHKTGFQFRHMAILYRSNAQSRVLEEVLLQNRLPYRIYGGLRFFERAEVKDVLAYLRLIQNRHDDTAFDRVVNLPLRGIGEKTVDQIRQEAQTHRKSFWDAALSLLSTGHFGGKTAKSLEGFLRLVEDLADMTGTLSLELLISQLIQKTELNIHYQKEASDKAQARLENLAELVSAAKSFLSAEHAEPLPAGTLNILPLFLAQALLESPESAEERAADSVQLMTLHAAKGLEFPLVFISGLEEDLFPSKNCLDDPKKLSEERRLCYVGMTRAMKQLVLTYAENRRQYGETKFHRPSRFIQEIPKEYLQEVRLKTTSFSTPYSNMFKQATSSSGFRIGQNVTHTKFGEGVVLQTLGSGAEAQLQIRFSNGETKWLMGSFVKAL